MAPSEASLIGGLSMSSCLSHDVSVKSKVLWLTRSPNSRLEGDETQLQQRRKAEKAASDGDIQRHISRRRGRPDGATRIWASTTDFEADDHNERRGSLRADNESEKPFSDWLKEKRQGVVQLVLAIGALVGVMALISITVARITGGPSLFLEAFAKSGFAAAFALIFVSEIGDKTFFIAALLAMRHSKSLVLIGSMAALTLMTIISVAIGRTFHAVPAQLKTTLPIGEYAAVALLLFFGFKSIKNAWNMPSVPSKEEQKEPLGLSELSEAEDVIKKSEVNHLSSPVGILGETFSLVFLAEWGDRSMLATIALGAAQAPLGVATGAIVGHVLATGLAVVGGAFLAEYISEKMVSYIGGFLFLAFAAATLLGVF